MNKKILSIWISALTMAGSANAQWEQLYIFGDSLSDAGAYVGNADAGAGQRFTTDPGQVWVENLGDSLNINVTANNPNNNNTDSNGNDYAQGGAQVSNPIGIGQSPSPQSAQPVTQQVQSFLTDHPGGDSNGLYIVWAGANDVFYNATLSAGGVPQDQISANIQNSAIELNQQIQLLSQNGAQTIIVPNLPDMGQTPASIMTAISTVGNGNPALTTALGAATLALRVSANTAAEQQVVKDNAIATAEQILGVPSGTVAGATAQVAGGLTQLSGGFNQALQFYSSQGKANIVPLDVSGFLNEVIANPAEFGFSNVTGFACNSPSSLNCSTGLYSPGSDDSFLFADSVHPSTRGHAQIAEYTSNVLSAPSLISTLPDVPISMGRGYLYGLEQQLGLIKYAPINKWSAFVNGNYQPTDFSGYNTIGDWDASGSGLTIGASYRSDDDWSYGIALARLNSNTDWANNAGGFDYKATYGSVYARYEKDGTFSNLIGSYGSLGYDDITRKTSIGSSARNNKGNSDGSQFIMALTGGMALWHSSNIQFGPLYGLIYQTADRTQYSEDGGKSDSLTFSRQSRDSFVAELGVFADMQASDTLNFTASLVREQEIGGSKSGLTSYVGGLSSNQFSLAGTDTDSGLWRIGISANMAITKTVAATASYNYRKGDDYESTNQFNLGIQVSL